MKATAEYGRDDVDSICKEVEGKSEEEVSYMYTQGKKKIIIEKTQQQMIVCIYCIAGERVC